MIYPIQSQMWEVLFFLIQAISNFFIFFCFVMSLFMKPNSQTYRKFCVILCVLFFSKYGHSESSETELAPITQKSNPVGFLDDLTAIEIGKSVDTLTPTLSQDGYRFGYWTAGDTRLADSGGRSLTTASVLVEGPLTLTAHYFPEDQDTDNDEVPDWFEYRNFGDLNQTGTDDPDEDGFSNNRENQLGQEATIYDQVADGGISFASSTAAFYYVQSYDRLDDIDLNKTTTMGLQPSGKYIGTFTTTDTKWNPNQDKIGR